MLSTSVLIALVVLAASAPFLMRSGDTVRPRPSPLAIDGARCFPIKIDADGYEPHSACRRLANAAAREIDRSAERLPATPTAAQEAGARSSRARAAAATEADTAPRRQSTLT